MRIQAGQHSVDRLRDKFLVFYRLDVIALDATEYFSECAELFDWKRMQHPLGFLVGIGRKIEAQHHACDHAEDDQAKVPHLVTH